MAYIITMIGYPVLFIYLFFKNKYSENRIPLVQFVPDQSNEYVTTSTTVGSTKINSTKCLEVHPESSLVNDNDTLLSPITQSVYSSPALSSTDLHSNSSSIKTPNRNKKKSKSKRKTPSISSTTLNQSNQNKEVDFAPGNICIVSH